MKAKDIEAGRDYAVKRGYGEPSRMTVVRLTKARKSYSYSGGGLIEDTVTGKPAVMVKNTHGLGRLEHIVLPQAVLRTWDAEEAARKLKGEATHRANLRKKQHNEVMALRAKQLAELFELYGIDPSVMRITKARWNSHDEIEFKLDDDAMADIMGKLTGTPVELAPYPKDED